MSLKLQSHCTEGNVTCDDVSYWGKSRKSGKSIKLQGRTKHSMCADGVTPCAFQGYEFRNRGTYFRVLQGGELLVMQGDKVLVEEKGEWQR